MNNVIYVTRIGLGLGFSEVMHFVQKYNAALVLQWCTFGYYIVHCYVLYCIVLYCIVPQLALSTLTFMSKQLFKMVHVLHM